MAIVLPIQFAVPRLVAALYVRPNEISIERPYIQTHIHATRGAFGLEQRLTEEEDQARAEAPINPAQHKNLLDNVRLWDWRAFHDTITQIQSLRPYYVFPDSDVDRYTHQRPDRQVMLAPRELDVRQLGGRAGQLDQPAFHLHARLRAGHGVGEVRITPTACRVLIIQKRRRR